MAASGAGDQRTVDFTGPLVLNQVTTRTVSPLVPRAVSAASSHDAALLALLAPLRNSVEGGPDSVRLPARQSADATDEENGSRSPLSLDALETVFASLAGASG
jgi:hypothetical protein